MKCEKSIYITLGIFIAFLFVLETNIYTDIPSLKEANISGLRGLIVNTSANIYLTKSEETSIKIEGEEELVNNLIIKEQNGDLVVDVKSTFNPVKFVKFILRTDKELNIYISSPTAHEIELKDHENLNICSYYESHDAKVLQLKNGGLFNIYEKASCTREGLSDVIRKHFNILT